MARADRANLDLTEEGVASLLCSSGLQRITGLGPIGLALVTVLVTWLPLLALSWVDHRGELGHSPVLRDVSVHVRCLVMIPALIAGERVVAFFLPWILVQIRASGVLAAEDEPRYKALLLRAARLRHSPWAIGVLVLLLVAPTHPDGAGGIGFVAELPLLFTPLIFAIASGTAADLAVSILAGAAMLEVMAFPIAGETAVLMALALFPLLLFIRPLRDMACDAYDDYSALLVRHGQRVQAKWIGRKPVDDREALLDALELGPVADVNTLFEAVTGIRPLQISREMLIKLAAVALVPFAPVALMTMPLNEIVELFKNIVL